MTVLRINTVRQLTDTGGRRAESGRTTQQRRHILSLMRLVW